MHGGVASTASVAIEPLRTCKPWAEGIEYRSAPRRIQNICSISFVHNNLRCLTGLNGATCAFGNFPHCLTNKRGRSSCLRAARQIGPSSLGRDKECHPRSRRL
jgi:hypothetical protein